MRFNLCFVLKFLKLVKLLDINSTPRLVSRWFSSNYIYSLALLLPRNAFKSISQV